MIIDYYFPDGFDMDDEPTLYLRTRDKDGVLDIRTISPDEDDYIRPYCWAPVTTPERSKMRVSRMIRGVRYHHNELAKGKDGIELFKISVDNPMHLRQIKDMIRTYEADMPYEDQVLATLYPEKLPEFHPRIWYFDLEWDVKNQFTTVMAVDDTHAEHPVVFAWTEESNTEWHKKNIESVMETKWIDREGGYELRLYGDERTMHNGFLEYLDDSDPDIFMAHAICWADLPHLIKRLDNPDRLSPLNDVVRPHFKTGYKETQQPITGRLIFDSAAKGSTGSGFETLWMKSGNGSFPNRKLDTIAKELKFEGKLSEDSEGNKLDVLTWWYTHTDLFIDYCLRDTTLLRQCSEKLNTIPFFIAMQQFCGVQWKSTHNVSNYARGLFGRYTDLKAPSSYRYNRDKLRAANVLKTQAGRWENVALLDFASLYPRIIVDGNLCPTTKRNNPGEGIRVFPDGSCWDTTTKGVLPRIVEDLLELRKKYKKLMNDATTEDERLGYEMLQLAVKVNTNALYGYLSQSKVGGMWTDPDVGAAITSMGRESIGLLMAESERQGFKVLAGHTDSCYVQVPIDKVDKLVIHLNETVRTQLNLPNIDVEFEAYFDYWFTTDAKNRNFGIITWPENKKGYLKVTGFDQKAANASPITKQIQEIIFLKISEGAEEDEINALIRPISLSLINGVYAPSELAPYGRLGKEKYDRVPPNAAKGALYYNEHLSTNDPIRVQDSAQWIHVCGVPEGLPQTNIVSFRSEDEIDGFIIDYHTMVDKFIKAKIKPIYNVLEWDLGYPCGDKVPKKYW